MKLNKLKNDKKNNKSKRRMNEGFNRPFMQFKDQLDELKKRLKKN